ncbi:MAG: PIN domain-containing protein [Nanoarchaeota archaeon]
MEVVLDANILFRTLISAGEIVDIFFDTRLEIIAPQNLLEEIKNNEKEILEKSKLFESEFKELFEAIKKLVLFIPKEEYDEKIQEARKILKNHNKDEDFVALAIKRGIKIWTYEKRLFDLGMTISTKEISEAISKQ